MITMDAAEVSALLDHVEVVVPCHQCGSTYAVPASLVRESQRLLAEGCSGTSLYECDASFYATLIEPDALDALARAWAVFCQSAATHGGTAITITTGDASGPDHDFDARAIQRWDDEGGRPPPRRPDSPC
jgi:hypothetical protein